MTCEGDGIRNGSWDAMLRGLCNQGSYICSLVCVCNFATFSLKRSILFYFYSYASVAARGFNGSQEDFFLY